MSGYLCTYQFEASHFQRRKRHSFLSFCTNTFTPTPESSKHCKHATRWNVAWWVDYTKCIMGKQGLSGVVRGRVPLLVQVSDMKSESEWIKDISNTFKTMKRWEIELGTTSLGCFQTRIKPNWNVNFRLCTRDWPKHDLSKYKSVKTNTISEFPEFNISAWKWERRHVSPESRSSSDSSFGLALSRPSDFETLEPG